MNPAWPDIAGVVLAGGQSRRFGTDKAFVPFHGTPMIGRVISAMEGLFEEWMIVGGEPEKYKGFGLPVYQDREPNLGPMGGIVTALERSACKKIFVVACDMPVLDSKVVCSVVEASTEFDAVIPIHEGIREYLMAVYHRRLLPKLRHCLADRRLSMAEFCGKLANVLWLPVEGDSWFNVNTREDLNFLEETTKEGARSC